MNEILEIFKSEIAESEIVQQIQDIGVTALQYGKFVLILIFGILLFSSLSKFIFGKEAQLNLAISSAMEILFVYVFSAVIYALGLQLQQFLTPLPFVTMVEDYMIIFPIMDAEFVDICQHVLKMLMIAFAVNLINTFIPEGERVIVWFVLRFVTVVLAIAAIYALELLLNQYLPQGFAEIAPTVLLCSLVALILLGSLKVFVGAAMAFLDPIVAALYTFFFANFIGRALAKAMVSTALLTALVVLLNAVGISVVHIAASALLAYIPLLLIVLALWYVVGRIF